MKIAYLMNQYPVGSCTFIRREILELEKLGMSIERFSIRYPLSEIKDEADKQELTKTRFILEEGGATLLLSLLWGVVTRPLKFLKALRLTFQIGWKSDRGIAVYLIYLAEACVLLRWLLEQQIEHVHAHFASNPAMVAMLCHELNDIPYSFTVHGPHDFDQPSAIGLTEKIQRAAFVVGISAFTKSQLYRWCDYSHWAKIHLIHCGVDELFLEQPFIPIPNEPRFVCIGRFAEQKGHLILLEAVHRLALENWKFKTILIGDGPLRPQIEALIEQFCLQDYVQIEAWATNVEVQQQLLNAQVMVLPSFAEGLPVVIMEAFALSRPVISTYIAGIPELVEPNLCGWLVPSGSIDALADAMRSTLQTPVEKLTDMGKAGRERVMREHKAASEAQKLAALLEKYRR